jgi:hypothetical protein
LSMRRVTLRSSWPWYPARTMNLARINMLRLCMNGTLVRNDMGSSYVFDILSHLLRWRVGVKTMLLRHGYPDSKRGACWHMSTAQLRWSHSCINRSMARSSRQPESYKPFLLWKVKEFELFAHVRDATPSVWFMHLQHKSFNGMVKPSNLLNHSSGWLRLAVLWALCCIAIICSSMRQNACRSPI